MNNHIVLIGMRGAGKSHSGRKIAKILGLPFVDLDIVIQKQEGMKIEEMVKKYGWDYFRDREHEMLEHLKEFRQSVIATGGGAPVYERNQGLIKSMGIVVWMFATESIIVSRLKKSKATHRPSLTGKDMVEELVEVYRQRKGIYKKMSDWVFQSQGSFQNEFKKFQEFLKKTGWKNKNQRL